MRIRRLDLKAFGPFSDRQLDFSTECPGLHIVYGPNEAGKSSCLRALKALFFGIPTRTGDSFLHSLRPAHGGRLPSWGRWPRARPFTVARKRRPICSIGTMTPSTLRFSRHILQGVEPELFESLYGIDHEALVRGGQEILNQKGDVGQAIFAAGAGLTSLKGVLDELEKEGDELFQASGFHNGDQRSPFSLPGFAGTSEAGPSLQPGVAGAQKRAPKGGKGSERSRRHARRKGPRKDVALSVCAAHCLNSVSAGSSWMHWPTLGRWWYCRRISVRVERDWTRRGMMLTEQHDKAVSRLEELQKKKAGGFSKTGFHKPGGGD